MKLRTLDYGEQEVVYDKKSKKRGIDFGASGLFRMSAVRGPMFTSVTIIHLDESELRDMLSKIEEEGEKNG